MPSNPEKSVNKPDRALDMDGTIVEIELYLHEKSPVHLVKAALVRLANRHGAEAIKEVIETLNLKNHYKGEF